MDKFEQLKELKKLLDNGVISQDEFNGEKRKLLNVDGESANSHHTGVIRENGAKSNKSYLYILVGVGLVVLAYWLTDGFKSFPKENTKKTPLASVNVYYEPNEIFPVHLLYLKNIKQGLIDLSITNPAASTITYEVTFGFSEFGEMESQTVSVESGSVKRLQITPFSNKLMEVFSPVNTSLLIKVSDNMGNAIYSNTWDLKVNPCDEIPWRINNEDFSKLIASWVTPKNAAVENMVGLAREELGYAVSPANKMNSEEFHDMVKAIFNTLRDEGVSYLSSTISFGEGYTQRVRLPEMSIQTKSANCIDGSVLLASMFENVGLRPYIVILPAHAIVGVSLPNNKKDVIFIETTQLGRPKLDSFLTLESTYAAATRLGNETYNEAYSKYVNEESGKFEVVDIHKAREEGVMPIN